ncbi:MAG: hypothetical protein L0956_10315 [Candidatus Mariimomonas ferrooxydans]
MNLNGSVCKCSTDQIDLRLSPFKK